MVCHCTDPCGRGTHGGGSSSDGANTACNPGVTVGPAVMGAPVLGALVVAGKAMARAREVFPVVQESL